MRKFMITTATVLAVTGFATSADAGMQQIKRRYSHVYYTARNHTSCKSGVNIRRQGSSDVGAYTREIKRLNSCIANASAVSASGWTIPTAVVMCESGGQNLPPNSASASGYYQIIRSTWEAYGGLQFASEAYLATREEQGIIAERIWRAGGPSQWVCKA